MRIVFMGTPEFAVPSLTALLESRHQVIAVFTQPDRPRGRGNKVVPPPVKVLAQAHGVPVYQPGRIRKESVGLLRELQPDLYVTAAFGQILSQELLDIPARGCVNVHASLLPRHRGSAPINWAILQGDAVTGVTTMLTDRGIDTGDMLLKAETPIAPEDTAGELTDRLSRVGAQLLLETLDRMEAGTLTREKQDEAAMTYDPMLDKAMGYVDWTKPAVDIVRLIHGLNPAPGASAITDGGRLKLHRAKVAELPDDPAARPGTVVLADPKKGLFLQCGSGVIELTQVQAAGGKPMSAKDYLRGHPVTPGTVWKEEDQ